MPRSPTQAEDAEKLARASVDKLLGTPHAAALTPPLPLRWPPEGDARLLYFAYTERPAATSTDRVRVWSPAARIAVRVDESGPRVVEETRLEAKELGEQAGVLEPVPRARLAAAAEALLRVVAAPQPQRPDLDLVRGAYARWAREHHVLCADLRRRLPPFFEWLEAHDEPAP